MQRDARGDGLRRIRTVNRVALPHGIWDPRGQVAFNAIPQYPPADETTRSIPALTLGHSRS